jgi:hypothetical protein
MMNLSDKKRIKKEVLQSLVLITFLLIMGASSILTGLFVYQGNQRIFESEKFSRAIKLDCPTRKANQNLHNNSFIKGSVRCITSTIFNNNNGISIVQYQDENGLSKTDIFIGRDTISQFRHSLSQYTIMMKVIGILSVSILVITFLHIQRHKKNTWVEYLNCYFPEEVVSDMTALHEKLTQEKRTNTEIFYRLLCEVIHSAWAFYIQIKIDNLQLPSDGRRIGK